METFLSVDPGTKATGVAVWPFDRTYHGLCPPTATHLLMSSHKKWGRRSRVMAAHLRDLLVLHRPVQIIYCELPGVFESAKGMMAAVRGDVVKLTFLVGMFAGVALEWDVPFFPVPVRHWKGQLPKRVVENRIREKLGPDACITFKRDVWDAVGIGLFAKGVWK